MKKFAVWGLVLLFLTNIYVGAFAGWGNIMAVSMIYHTLGGFFVALLLSSLYDSEFAKLPQSLRFLVIMGCTIGIGAVWEMSEYLATQTLTQPIYNYWHYRVYFMGDLTDTIQDLVMDSIGGLLAASTALYLFQRRNSQNPQTGPQGPSGNLHQ